VYPEAFRRMNPEPPESTSSTPSQWSLVTPYREVEGVSYAKSAARNRAAAGTLREGEGSRICQTVHPTAEPSMGQGRALAR
jgi:hypothetical protein